MAETVIIANLSDALKLLQNEFDQVKADNQANNNAFFMCSMGLIIFFMQCGFAFLEAGAVRSKNTTNILIKNVLDSCIVIVAYAITGYAFAYGGDENSTLSPFMGTSGFFMNGVTDYPKFFFQYVFAATAATIVSGAVVERCEFVTYLVYCTVISAVVYPILTHWGWSPYGWMAAGIAVGEGRTTYIDFAGAGMVHLCGGTISFFAAYMIGPRIGRFPEKEDSEVPCPEIQGHSVPFAALGGFILMFGFLAFNGGSTADITTHDVGKTVALAMTNTIMSGAFAALVFLSIHYLSNGKWTLILTINACLAGMVAACGACNNMDPWAAALVGTGASFAYLGFSKLMLRLKIDDPLDAFAVHAGGGLWGLIGACLFSRNGLLYNFIDFLGGHESHVTLAIAQLGWQLLCALAIIVWSSLLMIPVFWILKKIGKFRVRPEVEIKGLDIWKHGEAAYPIHAYGHGWNDIAVSEDGHKKSFSALAEISIEELANAYERKTSVLPKVDTRKLSFYHNKNRYEHPEHHQINMKNGDTKTNGASHNTKQQQPLASGGVLGITINDDHSSSTSPTTRRWNP